MATRLAEGRHRYRVQRRLGGGATSDVWLAEREGSTTRVAIKVARQACDRDRLCDEAERLLFADCPALTAALDAGFLADGGGAPELAPGLPFIALEWADGESLEPKERSRRDPTLALRVAADVAEALAALHSLGSSHGDVKPANVVVNRAGRARLIDLGLSTDAGAKEPAGGTPRYLAPELFDPGASSDGRARDLWALGLTLAEIADPELAAAPLPAEAWQASALPPELGAIVAALLGPPAARPSAAWVRRRALVALGQATTELDPVQRRRAAVRRSYLAVRRHEIEAAARFERSELCVDGAPGEWTAEAIERLRQIHRVRGRLLSDRAPVVGPLDVIGRSRWLVALVGASAAAWPDLGLSDDPLAERLLELCSELEPETLSLAHLASRGWGAAFAPPCDEDGIDLALALAQPMPAAGVLERAESLVHTGRASDRFRVELSRKLRLRGELGRALSVLDPASTPRMRVEAAEILRRAGERQRALQLLEGIDWSGTGSDVSSRRAAIVARLTLDAGDAAAALARLEGQAPAPAVLETRALCELSKGRRAAALRSVEQARALAGSEEERARIEAVAATLAHAGGDAAAALRGFEVAAEHAARAGALLEEATYQTGVAAAASNLAELGTALTAARRAILLFEHLGRKREAARAALSRAAVYAQAGALIEAREAAEDAIRRAKAAEDRRCRAYAHLALADVLPEGDREGIEHAERARQLLMEGTDEDRLRAAARLLARGGSVDVAAFDAIARDPAAAVEARLDWWGARALAAAAQHPPQRPETITAELLSLIGVPAPVCARGAAFSFGARLAARSGDGDAARRLALASAEAGRQLSSRAPPELQVAVGAIPWLSGLHVPRERELLPEQVQDVEALVRALGRRDRLRPLLDQVLDALVLWTGVERGLLLLRAPGGKLVVRAARNLLRSDLTGEQLALSRTLAERALGEREPVVAVDAAGELSEVFASVHSLKLRSVLAVPLLARGEALGVVYLDDRVRRGAFGPEQLGWVRLVATLAAVAIADARDQLLLRKAARRAQRAEARLASELARSQAELDVAERELARSKHARDTRFDYSKIIGRSGPVRDMLRLVDRVTSSEVPVLILGESGSGKELVARAVHDNGPRRKQPFVSENCAAIPEPLLESTLFGHVRGAFTGASRPRAGLFEVADHGTLFLDEIGEMTLPMQTKLLRVLEEGELWPIGSERPRRVDVRIIAATHRDLDAMVATGRFRQDLLYRLNVIRIRVPPLRERPGDIALLVDHFVARYGAGRRLRFTKAALGCLSRHGWPGNVRQLENEVRRALVLADDVVDVEHLSPEVVDPERGERRPDGLNLRQRVDALELELVTMALERTAGNQTRAAELLGVSRFGLQKMMKRLDILPEVGKGRPVRTH